MNEAFRNHRWREPRSWRERIEDSADWFFDSIDRPIKVLVIVALVAFVANAIAHARGP